MMRLYFSIAITSEDPEVEADKKVAEYFGADLRAFSNEGDKEDGGEAGEPDTAAFFAEGEKEIKSE